MNAIPCLTWVKRGLAKAHPDKLRNLDLSQVAEEQEDVEGEEDEDDEEEWDTEDEEDAEDELGSGEGSDDEESEENEKDDIKEKYNMSDYDDEEDQAEDDGTAPMSLKGLACFSSNREDPYLAKDEDSDADEDLEIKPDDNLILMGKFQRDYSALNVYVYNEKNNYLYCHHDSLLLGFPLCMEWLNFDPGEQRPGNLVAVGYMEPDIEIWDVDVLDSIEPAFVLKGNKKKKKNPTGHRDAVLDLSWNPQQRNVIASASADETIGLWDLMKGKIVVSLTDHEDKVQTLKWHPVEAETLLSGAFDKSVKIHDVRTPGEAINSMTVSGEVEKVIWDWHNPFCFFASCDDGCVHYFDTRNTKKGIFKLQAHDSAACGMCLSPSVAGCLVTASSDKLLKVWDVRNAEPEPVFAKELQIGELHSLGCCPDSPMLFAVGGDREMRVLNLQKHSIVTSHFGVEYVGKEKDEWEVAQSDESEDEDEEMDPKEMMKGWQAEGKREADQSPVGKAKKKKRKKEEGENVEPVEGAASGNGEAGKKKRKRKKKKKDK
ncbi:hypothetical protein CAPTEDRAFT_174087 [Capitella teleta]|uniref:Uncharacterized protein n=1 Tax=Capitella teleta TaxID=283909 RepID=R7TPE4_CAPTE|nr:hypothetical protein CAPTEDRAFT_174087 [Capitella teleta]|eukprot:ELT95758.1 hypothetical protein CAPTEDRAFT_174087 [Capitella teleta]